MQGAHPGAKEHPELAGEQVIRQGATRGRVAQAQQVRRDAHVLRVRLAARFHLPNQAQQASPSHAQQHPGNYCPKR
jgi:hypothetical protein